MQEKKIFGYPAFDADGEMILSMYDGPYRDMLMDVRVYRIAKGSMRDFRFESEETAVLLQSGDVSFSFAGQSKPASRKDVFSEGPFALHVCCGTPVEINANSDAQILVQRTYNSGQFEPRFYTPEDSPWADVCRGKFGDVANRFVNTIFDHASAPYSNMVLGEVLNDKGNWSAYIPHHHPQPELYYFEFDRPEGFGASFVGDDVFKITHGSFSAIPGGLTHPQAVAPGYRMYTCWMIRHLEGNPWNARIDDKRYTWLYDADI